MRVATLLLLATTCTGGWEALQPDFASRNVLVSPLAASSTQPPAMLVRLGRYSCALQRSLDLSVFSTLEPCEDLSEDGRISRYFHTHRIVVG
ncbi:hypothetical protein T492DRAFT_1110192 [Pavlovales sp. CCMP2436]|nr:hypothetical protein T492DRAFT_1110192 [Pavlovales sp. CCMP2436]